ncbi:MAG TPA: helix-turn-helix domain-containing protein [Candidatus Dormibacteraeota bacterium]|nr:helix-turn-helix domain-containing protein [Candidatus Dormibacteraeota bacterium]
MATLRTLDEAARAAGIGRRTLDRLVADGKLKAYKQIGDRRHYIDMDELDRLRKPRPVGRRR